MNYDNHNITTQLYSKNFADAFELCYPQGNGYMGIMDDGNPLNSLIYVNEYKLWSGYTRTRHKKTDINTLNEIKDLTLKNKIGTAEKLIEEKILGEMNEVFLPLATAKICCEGNYSDYERKLDLIKGIHYVNYILDGVKVSKTSFCSNPSKIYYQRISSEKPIKIAVGFESQIINQTYILDGSIIIKGKAPSKIRHRRYTENAVTYDDNLSASFETRLIIKCSETSATSNSIQCIGSLIEVFIITAADKDIDVVNDTVSSLLCAVDNFSFQKEIAIHTNDFSSQFLKTSFTLYNDKDLSGKTTDDIVKNHSDSNTLDVLFFNFAKYLSISASRNGGNCMNLQGIWNKDLRPMWNCNYTININTEMNYWIQSALNLHDSFMPLVELVEKIAKNGEIIAKEVFHARGFVCGHNTDGYGNATVTGGDTPWTPVKYNYFLCAGGWLLFNLFEHYNYTEDLDYLKRIYPLMIAQSLFYVDYLSKDKKSGYYIACPSTSPENEYFRFFKKGSITKSSTMDVSIIKSLFENTIKAAKILNYDEHIEEITERLNNLPPYELTKDGKLKEWAENRVSTEKNHRHISPLFALYPYNDISNEKDKKIYDGAVKLLMSRGLEGTGWSIAWKACVFARLKNSEVSYKMLKRLLTYTDVHQDNHQAGIYSSLLATHPPFQIDANFGGAACIIEMLVQSDKNNIELLPCMPKEWQKGEVKGFAVRGGFIIDFKFENNKVYDLKIYHKSKSYANIMQNGKITKYAVLKMS